MGKLKTSFAILNILSDHQIHTAYSLAKATATTEKKIRSYISYMRLEGIEIHTFHGQAGGYKLIDCTVGYDINNNLTEDDIKTLERAIQGFSELQKLSYYESIIYDLNYLRTKIKGVVEHKEELKIPYEPEEHKPVIIFP